jgi:hypothetical protein
MTTNEFWLQLHRLAGCLEAEGPHRRERLAKIVAAWEMMPRSARETVADELTLILDELPELGQLVRAKLSTSVPPPQGLN